MIHTSPELATTCEHLHGAGLRTDNHTINSYSDRLTQRWLLVAELAEVAASDKSKDMVRTQGHGMWCCGVMWRQVVVRSANRCGSSSQPVATSWISSVSSRLHHLQQRVVRLRQMFSALSHESGLRVVLQDSSQEFLCPATRAPLDSQV